MEDSTKKIKPLTKALTPPPDRGEHVSLMEPLLVTTEHNEDLADLVLELASESASFSSSIPEAFAQSLATLVRAMNCYYSNLIEGHDTHPVDIERALKKDYSSDFAKRNLQLEAEAHIAVQAWIDDGGISGKVITSATVTGIHRRFCQLLPDDLLWVEEPKTGNKIKVMPGEYRTSDVKVGHHVAISPGSVARFMQRYEQFYSNLNRHNSIVAAAAAHHRLLWIHPFLDGNGRVARLLSHASLKESLGSTGIWSVARGLARKQSEYKNYLMKCDDARHGDHDGRGPLSEESLATFTRFFLETCLDQVKFMRTLVRPDLLRTRVLVWAKEEIEQQKLPPRSTLVLETLLRVGELPRGEVQSMLDVSPATARRIISALTEQGIVVSETTRAPLKLAFPASLASRWFPGLFPDK